MTILWIALIVSSRGDRLQATATATGTGTGNGAAGN